MTESILTPEQVTRIKARERKQNQRTREKQAKAAEKKELREQTPHAFWAKNRAVANQTQIAELERRQAEVFNLLEVMRDYIAGTDCTTEQDLQDTIVEVREDVAANGICQMEVYLLNFQQDADLYAELMAMEKVNEATKQFLRYGLVTAIPDHRLHEWQEFLESRTAAQPQGEVNGNKV